MIEFALAGIHPSYERVVVDLLRGLDADYPFGGLKRVVLFAREGDHSIADASEPGEIKLNSYWFGKPIEVLQEASNRLNYVYLGNGITIPWHGRVSEPAHVLAHEFGHCLQYVIPGWKDFATVHWSAACRDPVNCRPVSGYSFISPDEFWADTFSSLVNNDTCESTRLMNDFLTAYKETRL